MSDVTNKPQSPAPTPAEWAIAVMALAFFVAVLFQSVQLIRERSNLNAILVNQENTVQDVLKLRQQVNSLAGDTAQMAQGGNAAAKQVADELARLQITIHPPENQPAPTAP